MVFVYIIPLFLAFVCVECFYLAEFCKRTSKRKVRERIFSNFRYLWIILSCHEQGYSFNCTDFLFRIPLFFLLSLSSRKGGHFDPWWKWVKRFCLKIKILLACKSDIIGIFETLVSWINPIIMWDDLLDPLSGDHMQWGFSTSLSVSTSVTP